jgi:lactate dehydrogenase-like 2-hydroxyacid dehydrogenase
VVLLWTIPHHAQSETDMPRIAIFDDYQNVALELADWSPVTERATVTVFNDHLSEAKDIVDRLRDFDAVCVMRERTPLTRDILERLPRLKLIASTGSRNASIDVDAAAARGIEVMHSRQGAQRARPWEHR